jgi:hypothetical protein
LCDVNIDLVKVYNLFLKHLLIWRLLDELRGKLFLTRTLSSVIISDILTDILYGCETRSLTSREERGLKVFEYKMRWGKIEH